MCGIFGFAGPHSLRAASILQALAIADQVRGHHSTGLAIATKRQGTRRLRTLLVKKALAGAEFVRRGYTQALFRQKYNLAVGHNRLASSGAVTDRNAHPFRIRTPRGSAYAVHNGCVGGKPALAEEFGVRDVPVDSEVMFRAIARQSGRTEKDLLDSIERVVRFVAPRADFACIWMEPRRRAIYFWRSAERPLVVLDGRRVGLGRFLASTVEIFTNAWGKIRGMLPAIKKVSYFEAKPFSIYRVADDGEWEVAKLREIETHRGLSRIPSEPRPAFFHRETPPVNGSLVGSQATLFDAAEDAAPDGDEDERRFFRCELCFGGVPVDAAVFLDPATGEEVSSPAMGRPYHDGCAEEARGSAEVA